jgi:hypothetical protein
VNTYKLSSNRVLEFEENQSYDFFIKKDGFFLRGWPNLGWHFKPDSYERKKISNLKKTLLPHFGGQRKTSILGGLSINTSEKKEIVKLLNSKVFDCIEKELLAREAYKGGYQNYPSVIEEIAMWKDYYLQQTSLSNEMKIPELNDSTLYAYYQRKQKKKTEMVKVKYFFHNDIQVVKEAFEKMKAEIDLSDSGTEQSLVYSPLSQDEWFPEFQIQQLLNIKESLLENELYGPVQTDGGFLLVKVKEKQMIKTGIQNYNDVKGRLKNELAAKLGKKELMNKTAGLASQYKIKNDHEVLKDLKPTNINMFTIRKMGFGGSISGVPVNSPNFEWPDLLDFKQLLP